MDKKVFQVSDLVVDTSVRQLFRHGEALSISSRAFDVLECLIENRGRLVEKSELLERVWFDSFVEESNLAVHISALRRILSEKPGETKFIKTTSGRGYTFIAPVTELAKGAEYFANTVRVPSLPSSDDRSSIAVLPFSVDKINDDLEYLADGITQSLIDDLSKLPNLKVLAFSAVKIYRNSHLDLQEIGFLIGADKILTAHILEYRKKLEVRVELVNAADRSYIWGKQAEFDVNDIFSVKREITAAVAVELKLKLAGDKISEVSFPENLDAAAQKLYFRGKFVLESRGFTADIKGTLLQALNLFKQAIELEPRHALAYTGIGAVYGSMFNHSIMSKADALVKAHEAIDMAITIDPLLSQAHVLKGSTAILFDRRFEEGNVALDRAIELNPNNADAYHWKAYALMCRGRFPEAFTMELKATEFDPISTRFNSNLTRLFYFSEEYEKAIVQAEEILEFEKQDLSTYLFLAFSHAELGNFDEARRNFERVLELRDSPYIRLAEAFVLILMEKPQEARSLLSKICRETPDPEIDYAIVALIYAKLNEVDNAFQALEHAIEKDDADLNILYGDHRFRNLHNDPRFVPILKRLGFDPVPFRKF